MKRDEIMQAIEAILKRGNDAEVRRKGGAVLFCVFFIFFVLFIFDHFVYQEKIAINGVIYIQKGENITSLPANNTKLGHLRSITHNSTSDPSINFTATNLDEKYAGCPIYQSEDYQTIYLEDYSGFYIPFKLIENIAQQEN